jgi:hypothetical protein
VGVEVRNIYVYQFSKVRISQKNIPRRHKITLTDELNKSLVNAVFHSVFITDH